MKPNILQTLIAVLMGATAQAQVNSGSDGSDGALDFSSITATTNIVINMANHMNGIYQYTYINIPTNVTVTFVPNANNSPVTWLVQSNALINGTINVSGQDANGGVGGAGGPGGWAGGSGGSNPSSGQGPGGGIYYYQYGPSASGGSYGGLGQPTGYGGPGAPGPVYGNSFLLPLLGGSGGGGSTSGGGGGGGGAILIAASNSIQLNGQIVANGGNGVPYSNSNVGGGSSGGVRLVTMLFSGNGIINAGGSVSTYGVARGGAGRVRIDAYQNSFGGQYVGVLSQGFQPILIQTNGPGIQLAIATVGGAPVSVSPTGQFTTPDTIIPGSDTNPIPVVVSCQNLPLNTPVTVTLDPANGSSVSVIGTNKVGTLASSTATVSFVIPRGGGIIWATAVTGN